MLRMWLIKILIKSLWCSYKPVNILRMAFNENNEILKESGYITCKNIVADDLMETEKEQREKEIKK